jgi:hypothetical protein
MSAWAALWPNITTDFVFVWVAARVIDGLSEARQQRLSSVSGLRGALNYLMRIGVDLLPNLYDWRIRDLKDELRWFQMRLERSNALKSDEVKRAAEISGRVPTLIQLAEEVRSTRSEISRLQGRVREEWETEVERASGTGTRDFPPQYKARWLSFLDREYGAYATDVQADQGGVRVAVAESRRQIEALGAGEKLSDLLNRYISAIEVELAGTESLRAEASALASSVRDNEMILLERARE